MERFLEPVAPYEFYREIFPEGSFERKGHFEDRKGNGIAVTVQKVEVDKATGIAPVSYTHLDVYKRQGSPCRSRGMVRRNGVLSLTRWTNCGS